MHFDSNIVFNEAVPNANLTYGAMRLREAVRQADQWGLIHIMTADGMVANHPNREARDQIRENIREMTQGYCLLFYYSIWEHCFSRQERNQILEEWMTPDETLIFRAIKHIRHSVAHSFDGRRADNNRVHFESVMASENEFTGIVFDDETIDISNSRIANQSRDFLSSLGDRLIRRLTENRPPVQV